MNKSFLISLLFIVSFVLVFENDAFARKKKKKVATQSEVTKPTVKETPYQKLFKGKACETVKGLFTIHKTDNKIYFEIPLVLLERELLLGSTISETTNNLFGSVGEKPSDPFAVTFFKVDSTLHLGRVNTLYKTELENVTERLKESTRPAAIFSNKILAYNPDSTAVVMDVTNFFLADNPLFPPFSPYAPITGNGQRTITKMFKKDKSQFAKVKAFEDNASLQTMLTYEVDVRDKQQYYMYKLPFSTVMTYSFILLPEEQMRPRIADPRIGIFYQGYYNIEKEHGLTPLYCARRWRLEPSDEAAFRAGKLVEPKKQIVFYVDNAFPEFWKEYIKEGIEMWQRAFEEIGFKNAIVARDFPKDDPEFDPDNLKYSCVRYSPSPVQNAMGPSWTDPRTGEVLNASVYLYHNMVQLVQNWRFLQTSPADPDVRKTVLDEKTTGECIRYVVSHEIGHCLSLMHNMAASAAIPTDSLRSPSFTQRVGTTYSIMDYARNNYVAQPGDKERGVRLTPPDLGLYDYFTIKWLYTPLLDVKTSRDELPILREWITEKSGDPIYRYGKQQIFSRFDPSSVEEDLGDDPVKSSTYGIKNLKYVLANMNTWVGKDDPDFTFQDNMYNEVIYQYIRYLNNVLANIGGLYLSERYDGDQLPSYSVVPRERQRQSLKFVLNELENMNWLNVTDLQQKMAVRNNISDVLEPMVFKALMYKTAFVALSADKDDSKRPYTPQEFLKDMADHVFAPTRQGRTLTVAQKRMQNALLGSFVMAADIARAGGMGGLTALSNMIEIPEEVKQKSRQTYGVLPMEMLGAYTNMELAMRADASEGMGFDFRVNLNPQVIPTPVDYLYFDMLKQLQSLVKSQLNSGSTDTRQHYRLLLHKLDKALK